MKTVLKSVVMTALMLSLGMGAEAVRMGAYIGQLPAKIDFGRRDGYPLHYGTWAGNVYLYKQNKEVQEWVGEMKTKMIKEALSASKSYAESNGYRYFAVDNIHFQVVHTDNAIELYFDGNVVVWK
ncbi:MAG: hypothetical protein B6D59_08330 [Campylobacteraceae bacterium 4484_4]|uniref:hypothetical protein n=1 Tax=Hydrogenimonas sp. TaxID=2231112 RepID=UPI000A09CA7A|nr:hypothetical protein [Hydrogenimonas sp.]OQX72488.1 MAG: hypothetical protein B6D59_08330 [Campylobacteraceae bacterium 4484_4]